MIVVAACTYKRPDFLERLLAHWEKLDLPDGSGFLVVDNDTTDPKIREMVEAFGKRVGRPTVYAAEPQPGIAAVRNAAFRAARAMGGTMVAMLDDDEWPPEQWVRALLAERERTGAQVVGGPVRPVFSEKRAAMRQHARFWSVEAEELLGKPFVFCTCNFLLEFAAADFLGDEPFDESFSMTGGSDTVFFRRLFDNNVPMAWTEDAWISEEIPDNRASLKWLRQRRFRMGSGAARWERELPMPGQTNPIVKTMLLAAALPIYPFRSREKTKPLMAWLLEAERIRGRIAAHLNIRYEEYKRPAEGTAGAKKCR